MFAPVTTVILVYDLMQAFAGLWMEVLGDRKKHGVRTRNRPRIYSRHKVVMKIWLWSPVNVSGSFDSCLFTSSGACFSTTESLGEFYDGVSTTRNFALPLIMRS